jgi:hypothetical protein
METLERFLGCLAGLACGDAVSTTLEFHLCASFAPVTDIGGAGRSDFSLGSGQMTRRWRCAWPRVSSSTALSTPPTRCGTTADGWMRAT